MQADQYRAIIDCVDLGVLRDKKLFITGGTGFFGRWMLNLIQVLNEQGYQIEATLLSRNPDAFLDKNPHWRTDWLHWVKGDVINYEWPSGKFDLFIHGAADTTPEGLLQPAVLYDGIVSGTKHVLAHAAAAKAKRVLFISSGAVYGEVAEGLLNIPENAPIPAPTNLPSNSYGEGKRAAEIFATNFALNSPVDVIIARCFAFMGTGIGQHLALNQFIRQAQQDKEIVIKGSGSSRRSFLHGRDLAVWLFKLLLSGKSREIYNVGSDKSYTIKELAELVRDKIAPDKKVVILGAGQKEVRMNYVPSVEKARGLGLDAWTPIEQMLADKAD